MDVEIPPFPSSSVERSFRHDGFGDLPSTSRCDEECPQIPPRSIQKRIEVGHGGGADQRRSSETRERVEGVNDVAKNASASTSRERGKLIARFESFQRGDWHIVLEASGVCHFRAAQSSHRSRRRHEDEVEQRALRAEGLIKMGELSHARQALEGAALAPGNQATLDALQESRT